MIPFLPSTERLNIQDAMREHDNFGFTQMVNRSQKRNLIEAKTRNTVHQSTQAIVSLTPSATDLLHCDSNLQKTHLVRESQESQIDNGNMAQYSREAIERDIKILSESTQNLNNSIYPSSKTFIHKNIENVFKKKEHEKYFKKIDDKSQSQFDIDQLMQE